MNILGISGAIGWDGNELYSKENNWIHGAGATLIIDGELKNSMCVERFSRIKYDGNYPKLAIQNILDYNKLTKHDIDLVVFVGNCVNTNFTLKQSGYIGAKLKEYFPNCKVDFLGHHMAHTAATFYSSGFEEANILTFDAAGDHELQSDGQWLVPHFKFSQGKDLTLTELHSEYCWVPPLVFGFGNRYNYFSAVVYKNKMNLPEDTPEQDAINRETYPGKVMGLAAFGDYQKIDLPDIFNFERKDGFPQLCNSPILCDIPYEHFTKLNPDDLAAWSQHQFEKYLLLFLDNIPKKFKLDNLCLGGGCALNILANSKIIEQGIYKNVHVNTAPNDDGLHFGAALFMAAEYEKKITLPDDIGYLGITYTDEDIEEALCVL